MRIGIVCPYSLDRPGGVQLHVLDLAEALIARGHHVSVLAPAGEDTDVPPYVFSAGRSVPIRYNGATARVTFGMWSAARVRLWLGEGEFDVVHSNAVIEHVGGRERQLAFVREALRVGRRVFLTTPNRWFPVEVHTRLPLVHWLPDDLAGRAYDLAGKSWARENHLLGPADLRGLFPVPVRISNLGLTLVAST